MFLKYKLKTWLKYLFLAVFGGGLYYFIELTWRGKSHWTMFVLGGIVFVYAGIQNEYTEWDTPFIKQLFHTECFTLLAEFLTGCVVNLWLKWDVWDYSNLPGNLLGQTSWQFALLFLPLCAVAIVLDDYLRYWFFGEEFPKYHLL